MKSIITTILVVATNVLLGQNFKDEDWEKLDEDEKDLVTQYANGACDCLTQYNDETEAFLSIILKFAEVKRKGGTITPVLRAKYSKSSEDSKPYFDCLNDNALSEDEKQKIKTAMQQTYGEFESKIEVQKMRTQIVSYILKTDCGEGSSALKYAMRFKLISMHIYEVQSKEKKEAQ